MENRAVTDKTKKQIETTRHQLKQLALQRGISARLTPNTKPNTSLVERSEARRILEQANQQKNLETIVSHAQQLTNDEDTGSQPDADWMSAFLHLAAETQVSAMQQLWACILSQEIARPGSFSIKAMKTLKQMTQREATWFQNAYDLSVQLGGELNRKIILGALRPSARMGLLPAKLEKLNLGQFGLPYHHILQLNDLGLIYNKEMEMRPSHQHDTEFKSLQDTLIRPRFSGCRLLYLRFTPVGDELVKLLTLNEAQAYQGQLHSLLKHFFQVSG